MGTKCIEKNCIAMNNQTIKTNKVFNKIVENLRTIVNKQANISIRNILFVIRLPQVNENLDYIINHILRSLNYKLDVKYINDYKDFFDNEFKLLMH